MSYPGFLLVLDAGDVAVAAAHVAGIDLDGIPLEDVERAARLLDLGSHRAKDGARRLRAHAAQVSRQSGPGESE